MFNITDYGIQQTINLYDNPTLENDNIQVSEDNNITIDEEDGGLTFF